MNHYVFAADEHPASAGIPYTPRMTAPRRLAYAGAGTFIGLLTTFPNALTNVNLGTISGSLGLYAAEASILPGLYFGMNACSNLMLVKARRQFGIPVVTQVLLVLYAAMAVLQIAWPGLAMAAFVRIANGIATGALATLSVFYFLVVLPAPMRPAAPVLGVGLTQFGTPLARLVPVELLGIDQWQGMHWIELAVPLALLAVTLLAPLPPSDRGPAFEPADLISLVLLAPGIVLGCEVLGVGRVLWWHDTPWLGILAAASVALLGAGLLLESRRARPLLQLRWLSTLTIARFAAIALLMRLALAEQTFGAVGLLTAAGLDNDQLHTLFALVALAMLAGLVTAVLTLREQRLPWQVLIAALCIAASAVLDSQSSNLTRPPQLVLSQCLIGFGTTLFIGPTLVYGFLHMMRQPGDHFVSLVVAFSVSQNIGALAGAALMGSYQVERVHVHLAELTVNLGGTAGGAALLQALTREANILAFNDVFGVLAWLAGGTALAVALSMLAAPGQKAPA